MTRSEFEQARGSRSCRYCGAAGLTVRESQHHPGGGVWCLACNKFQFWLSIDRGVQHRPRLARGTLDDVWEAWGRHCSHCGLSEESLDTLGLARTVQHAPPAKALNGKTLYLLPYCSWCQQHSATTMKQLESLVARITVAVESKSRRAGWH